MRKSFHLLFVLSLLIVWCGSLLAQDASSFGLAPYQIGIEKGQPQYQGEPTDANTGFGNDALASPVNFLSMPIPAGTPFTTINANFTPGWLAGADMNDAGAFYGCTYIGLGQSNLVQVNTSTGAPTVIGPITGISQYPTSMAYNSANSTWYYGETDGATSRLYTLNVSTGAATFVGQITNVAGLIALAINCSGQAYAVDLVADNLYSVNLTTGAGTMIGPMGFNCNYAQDADFDAATGTLYLASYDLSAGASLRTCNTSTGGTTIIVTWPGSEITGFAIDNPCGPPCPVGPPTNPSPANGATNQPITGLSLGWTNGAGTTMNEVWFGPTGNVVKVYDGAAKTTHALGTLDYNKLYQWYIVCKDATCGTTGPGWSFTTMQNPNIVTDFLEPFNNLACWTPIGPLGTTNWSQSGTNFAGGASAPELMLSWTPSFNGLSKLLSCDITTLAPNVLHYLDLHHFCDFYADPAPFMGVGISYDNGNTYTTIWEFQPVGGNVGPENIVATFTPTAANYKLVIFCNGNSFNIDFWYVDDVWAYWIVPVELTSFTASANEGVVELSWITATETNNKGFEVQRSSSGEFETIAFVEGYGTTTEIQAYSYTDRNVSVGSYSYRLKQIDFDGSFDYSDIVEVDVPAPAVFALEQNYPNPFNPTTAISFKLKVDSKVSLKVFDVLGQEVATLVNTNYAAGSHKVDFDASRLNSGVYLYRIEATGVDGSNFVDVKKMILTK